MGIGFIRALADLTGADIAASNDLTGSQALGGDWALEESFGSIGASPVLGATVVDYPYLLAAQELDMTSSIQVTASGTFQPVGKKENPDKGNWTANKTVKGTGNKDVIDLKSVNADLEFVMDVNLTKVTITHTNNTLTAQNIETFRGNSAFTNTLVLENLAGSTKIGITGAGTVKIGDSLTFENINHLTFQDAATNNVQTLVVGRGASLTGNL